MFSRNKKKKLLIVVTSATIALSVTPAWSAMTMPMVPQSSVGKAVDKPLTAAVLNAQFIDQNGVHHTLVSLKGKTVFIAPYLTLCGDTCPFTTANMLIVQQKLNDAHAKNIEVIGIDVDPYRDNQARVSQYGKLIGANFQLWTEVGSTTKPGFTKAQLKAKFPVGYGDVNSNLQPFRNFFGWGVQVIPQSNPPATDWMAPHTALTYDINHDDGFYVIDSNGHEKFFSDGLPTFTGKISQTLASFMGSTTNVYSKAVYKNGWTPQGAMQAIDYVTNEMY
jgi:cytochrome oxidase Cu insertion factor (SCO1/SenC/PrrC family)